MGHTIRIMGEREEAARASAKGQAHGELLEKTAEQMMTIFPRLIRAIKHNSRSAGDSPVHSTFREMGESQVMALFSLHGRRQLTSELSKRFNVATPTMTRIIDGLVEKGYVERQPDPDDRRCIYLQVTPSGAEIAERAREEGREALARYLSPLTSEQLTDIMRAFGHLYRLLPDMDGEDCPRAEGDKD
jgi:DNA-binding MarR family transcriptional regulator